jgi:ABC-type branched-subunit amino acid transport system permease subunit
VWFRSAPVVAAPVLGSFLVMIANELLRPAKEFSPLVFGVAFIVFALAGLAGWLSRWRRRVPEEIARTTTRPSAG